MALIVETGTGLANAEAYVSVEDLRAWATGRGFTIAGSDTVCEQALRAAAQWIDTRWRYKGTRLTAEQALEFPRAGLADWSGFAVTGVPKRVKDATCELAYRAAAGTSLLPDAERSAYAKSKTVGPISVTYADGAPQSTTFVVAERLLQPYAKDPADQGVPFFGGATTGQFSIGMQSNPEADS